jgi:hypothetical protein
MDGVPRKVACYAGRIRGLMECGDGLLSIVKGDPPKFQFGGGELQFLVAT